MAISDVIYFVLACFSLAEIAENWSGVFTGIRIIGALYLLYLGVKMWRKVPTLKIETSTNHQEHILSFIQGFLISASNPKVIIFYIAFIPSFMDLKVLSIRDIIFTSSITLLALMLGFNASCSKCIMGRAKTPLCTEYANIEPSGWFYYDWHGCPYWS